MDLAKLDTKRQAEEGVEVELRNFDTLEPLGVFITVRGVDSAAFRDQMIANNRRARATLIAEKRTERTPQEIEDDAVDILVACTVRWRDGENPALELDGQRLECTPGNARALYVRFPWIRQQLDGFISDRANFLPRSGSSS